TAVEVVLPDVGVAVVDVDGPQIGEPAEVLLLPRSRREAAAAVSGPLERALEDVADHGIAVVPVVGTRRGQRGARPYGPDGGDARHCRPDRVLFHAESFLGGIEQRMNRHAAGAD